MTIERRSLKKKTQKRTRAAAVFLRFSDEELKRLKTAAGEFPFAAWCRTMLLRHANKVQSGA
jgi:hypothetical protein